MFAQLNIPFDGTSVSQRNRNIAPTGGHIRKCSTTNNGES